MNTYSIILNTLDETARLVDYLKNNNLHAQFLIDGKVIHVRSLIAIISHNVLGKELQITVDGDLSPFFISTSDQ